LASLVLGLLRPGDELVFLGPLYGGTEGLLRNLGERWGIRVVDATATGLEASADTRHAHGMGRNADQPHPAPARPGGGGCHGACTRGITTVADNTFCTRCWCARWRAASTW
jgi:methionine-gamma-lyase